ncbi:MAG: flagellar biosynthesis protein FlgF, partial [Mesorhizobium sp.]
NTFLTRFTSLWEINNPTTTAVTSVSVLFAQPTTVGISTDLMMAMQKLKF